MLGAFPNFSIYSWSFCCIKGVIFSKKFFLNMDGLFSILWKLVWFCISFEFCVIIFNIGDISCVFGDKKLSLIGFILIELIFSFFESNEEIWKGEDSMFWLVIKGGRKLFWFLFLLKVISISFGFLFIL